VNFRAFWTSLRRACNRDTGEPVADQEPRSDDLALLLLVLRCQAGDGAAFAELMRRFGNRTFGYLRGLIGNAAEDLQQDVWLAVYRSISALSNPHAFRTWLFRTTRHRAIDFLRRQRRERELLVDADVQALESVADGDAVSGIAEHASDERESLLDGVLAEAQLSSLSPLHREVLPLRFRDGMSYAEIAPLSDVRSGRCALGSTTRNVGFTND
jgi:RNA polymerase sigma-70 factor, ECF subfamily